MLTYSGKPDASLKLFSQMEDSMKSKMLTYLKGLGLTYLAVLIFSAVGWISIGLPFDGGKIVVPLLMALIIWTAMFFLSYAVWVVLLAFASCTFGLGFFIGLGVLGFVTLRLAVFLLPSGWATFTEDNFSLFLMGGSIALIDLIVDEEKRRGIVRGSPPEPDEDN